MMTKSKQRRGFTLIELLLVIGIVGLVLSLGIGKMKFTKSKPKPLGPLNLKESIVSSEWFSGHATLLCVDKCKSCYLRRDISSKFQAYSNGIDLTDIVAYTIDARDSLIRIEYERYKDKKICLKMDFYNNGSSTQIILKDGDTSYFLPAYFGEAQAFDSPEDAQDYWLKKSLLVSDTGDYY